MAIADHGTFEGAARALHISASAVSQRIRTLEREVGQVVVRRGSPCEPTDAGLALVRLGRQTRLLDDEARSALAERAGPVQVTVAVNADSLATWFRDVLADVAACGRPDVAPRGRGPGPFGGCAAERRCAGRRHQRPASGPGLSVEHLGHLRYRPAAVPALADRYRSGRGMDWQRMPVVVFNAKDDLQHEVLRARGVVEPDTVHLVPTERRLPRGGPARARVGNAPRAAAVARPRGRASRHSRRSGPSRRAPALAAMADRVGLADGRCRTRFVRGRAAPPPLRSRHDPGRRGPGPSP